jgi:hypothetical protein
VGSYPPSHGPARPERAQAHRHHERHVEDGAAPVADTGSHAEPRIQPLARRIAPVRVLPRGVAPRIFPPGTRSRQGAPRPGLRTDAVQDDALRAITRVRFGACTTATLWPGVTWDSAAVRPLSRTLALVGMVSVTVLYVAFLVPSRIVS